MYRANMISLKTTTRQGWKLAVLSCAIAVALGAAPFYNTRAEQTPAPLSAMQTMPASFADVVEQVKPAVVSISTKGQARHWQMGLAPQFRFPEGSPFNEFFHDFFDRDQSPQNRTEEPQTMRPMALGSGFIVSADGLVVTNYHVIKGAQTIEVTTTDGKTFPATLKGHDERTDLALLQIDTDETLPFVAFGDSDKTRVGDWVIAVGNPFGLGGSFTAGIVSARGRNIQSGPYDDFLQIDAPINSGNSGGPLFNTRGEVVGINTAIFSPNGGNVGIGFAVPSLMAQSVIGQLQESGHVSRGWLGVQIQDMTKDIADSLGLDNENGALVASVVEDSPAAKAGVKTGDVILSVNKQTVEDARDLSRIIANAGPQQSVDISVWRNNEQHKFNVALGDLSKAENVAAADKGDISPAQEQGEKLGVMLTEITPQIRQQQHLPTDTEGVLITDVQNGSPAAHEGLRPGDVIVMIGQSKVQTPSQVTSEVETAAQSERKRLLLLVNRNGNQRFVTVNLG